MGSAGRAGAPKIINETDRPAVRLGQSVLIRAFPPVAAGAERQAASEFNTRRRSCELEAQKDTVERRYVPRLIIRPVSFSPYMSPPSSSSLSTSELFFFFLVTPRTTEAHHASNTEQQWLQIKFFVFIPRLILSRAPSSSSSSSLRPLHNLWSLVKPISSSNFKLWEGKWSSTSMRKVFRCSSQAFSSLWAQD